MLWSSDFDLKMLTGTRLWSCKKHTESRLGHVNLRGFFLYPVRCRQGRKLTNDIEGNRYRILMQLPDQSLEFVSVFIEQEKSLYLIFLFDQGSYNLKTSGAWTWSIDSILYAFKKSIWWPNFFKGAQAWEFFDRVYCTKRTHLGMWRRDCKKNRIFLSIDPWFRWFWVFCRILSVR